MGSTGKARYRSARAISAHDSAHGATHRAARAAWWRVLKACSALACALSVTSSAWAQPGTSSAPRTAAEQWVVDANSAFNKRDAARLMELRGMATASAANTADTATMTDHPLAAWVAYWDANLRLAELQQTDLDAFYLRWSGTYVEDRLRNDWLLELGKRRDWVHFAADFPRFKLNDDREVTCYALLVDHLAGHPVRDAARQAWLAQRDAADDGCSLMASTLIDARVLTPADAWRKARLAMEINRPRAVAHAVSLANPQAAASLQALQSGPSRYLALRTVAPGRDNAELATLALVKLAANDPDAAAAALTARWERSLPADLAAWAWAATAKQSAVKLLDTAADQYARAEALLRAAQSAAAAAPASNTAPLAAAATATTTNSPIDTAWPDETLAWQVRAALRADRGAGRWLQVLHGIDAMATTDQRDPAWLYWKARAQLALATDSSAATADNAAATQVVANHAAAAPLPAAQPRPTATSEALRKQARELLASIAGQPHFYGTLASEQLGRPVALPPRPVAPSRAERDAAYQHAGLSRGLQMIALGLRSEGVREWNYSLRGMTDRELLAAAARACDREVWDRCINTSERTRIEIDMQQRFPTPYKTQVMARAQDIGLDAAYVYGLIRQESRFITDARSGVGASGLMQVMPATARWTAKRIGLAYSADLLATRDVNLLLGTSYLKLVLDDFAGSQPLAAAAYNAGPNRSRKWRDGPTLEAAVWAENIPFSETRDYVKKVLSNSAYYAALLGGDAVSLTTRLGAPIGPRDAAAPVADKELP